MIIVIDYVNHPKPPTYTLDGMPGGEMTWGLAVDRAQGSARGLEGLIYVGPTERIASVTHTPQGWKYEAVAVDPGDDPPPTRFYPYLLPAQLTAQAWVLGEDRAKPKPKRKPRRKAKPATKKEESK